MVLINVWLNEETALEWNWAQQQLFIPHIFCPKPRSNLSHSYKLCKSLPCDSTHTHTHTTLQTPAVSLSAWEFSLKPGNSQGGVELISLLPLSRGNLQPVGTTCWWENSPASHPSNGQLWGAPNRVLQSLQQDWAQLSSILTGSVRHPFLDLFTSPFYSS